MAPQKPDSKYARDIRFNPETWRWERRVTARWDVFYLRNTTGRDNAFETDKLQGLNLDTQRGFHYIERGLPADVPSAAFRDVNLSYPLFYSAGDVGEAALRRAQVSLVTNLHYIYDPFSWVARRDVRFRGGFLQECRDHLQWERLPVEDREWFEAVLARFLSDVVTIKLQGAKEIYSLHMLQKRLSESPRALGASLDLLNWNKGEERKATNRPEAEARISPGQQSGFRYVLIDAYQRFGDAFLTSLSDKLKEQKAAKQRVNGRGLFTQLIEQHAGLPYEEYAKRAKATQEAHLAQYKVTQRRGAGQSAE